MKIGIFDSGIGGLTVLKSLIKKYPNNKYYYYGDNINVPYGTKTKKQLVEYSNTIIKFLESKEVDLIIVACGTISSNVFNKLISRVVLYDVITPTLKYIKNLNDVGVIATINTINSNIFNLKYQKEGKDLVYYIENNLDVSSLLDDYLEEFKSLNYLILGCTHYPLISEEIKSKLDINLINMGDVLTEELNLTNNSKPEIKLYFSKVNKTLVCNIDKIISNYQLEELCLNYQK